MCLLVKSKEKIAEKDIIVYKVGYYRKNDNAFFSCYRDFRFELNKVLKSTLICSFNSNDEPHIEIGFHSFTSKKAAITVAKFWREIVFECVIPKGSLYYEGTFDFILSNRKINSIASDHVMYIKPIMSFDKNFIIE